MITNKYYKFKILLPVVILLILPACSAINRNIYIVRDKSLVDSNINVDLFGADTKQKVLINKASYSDYWVGRYISSTPLIKKMYFKNNGRNSLLLSDKNTIWDRWDKNNAEALFIIVNTEESTVSSNWKKQLLMERYSWFNFWSEKDLKIIISKKRITAKQR